MTAFHDAGLSEIDVLRQRVRELEQTVTRLRAELAAHRQAVQPETTRTIVLERTGTALAGEMAERQRIAEALRASEQKYRTLFNTVPVGLYRTTPAGDILDCNAAMAHMLGFSDTQALRQVTALDMYVNPQDRQRWLALIEQHNVVRNFETHWRRLSGEFIWVSDTARAIRDEHGQIVAYDGMVEDISERKYAAEELRQSQERYRAIVEDQTELICRFQLDGTLTFVNSAYARYFGTTPDALVGSNLYDSMPEIDRPIVAHNLTNIIQHRSTQTYEHRIMLPDGAVRWYQWTERAILNEQQQIVELQSVGRDITERKHAEEALRVQRNIAIAMSSASDQTEALRHLLGILLQIEGLDGGGIYLVDTASEALDLVVHNGLPAAFVRDTLHFAADSPQARTVMQGVPVVRGRSQQLPALYQRHGLKAAAIIPVQHEGQVVAALNVGSFVYDEILPDVRALLEVIAAQLGGVFARIQTEAILREHTRQLAAFFSHSVDGYFFSMLQEPVTWDATVDQEAVLNDVFTQQRITRFNQAILAMNGLSAEEFRGTRPCDLFAHNPDYGRHLWRQLLDTGRLQFEDEITLSGRAQPLVIEGTYIGLYDDAGRFIGNFGIHRDITERRAYDQRIKQLAFIDPLTELPNRNRLYELGDTVMGQLQTGAGSVALLYLDMNRFKSVNDTLGHSIGDELLILVARRLRACIREGEEEFLARSGGDEFVVVLRFVDVAQAIETAQHIYKHMQQPFDVGGQIVYLGSSIGVAISADDIVSFNTLLTQAETAMYRAKRVGGGVHLYDVTQNPILEDMLQLEIDLRQALQDEELVLFYQPLVHLQSRCPVAVEALVRWQHPQRGLLLPGVFLPLAEEMGVLDILDRRVMQIALQQLAAWVRDGYALNMSINLTAQSLQNPHLVSEIAQLLDETGAPAQYVIVEVTEHTALRDLAVTQYVLAELKKLGMRVALDDFGTGYASLTHLRQLPVDILKLDRAFATGIGSEAKDEAVVRALLELGRGLNLTIVIEGIEDEAQLDWIQSYGDVLVQGYLPGPPLPPEMMQQIVGQKKSASDVRP